ncbi:hypothetical protein BOVMAS33_00030 [Streptococcus uberis]|nr:hypothetical protein AF67_03450 [Streptococcus uberis 6780]
MKNIKYYTFLILYISPIFLISIFLQLRILGTIICVFIWTLYMGLDIDKKNNKNEFILEIE